jgi:hypothetical protein
MALTKVITGVTDLNQAQSTNGLKFPTGDVFAGTPEEGMIRNDQSQASEGSASTMQFYNGTAWKNFVNRDPTPLGSDNFNTVLYTGNSSTQAITGVGFAPDFVWIKRRNTAEDHALYDSVRGINKQLSSNTTAAEATNSSPYEGLNSFDSDGFTSGNNGATNRSPNTYVAWSWKAGGAAVSNTDGSITSSVSANTAAGFSIVSYTGNSSANGTVGHALNSAPELIIVKNRDNGSALWSVYSSSVGASQTAHLDTTAAYSSSGDWNSTTATTDVFSIGSSASGRTNSSAQNHIAYCFASVAGYSKIGSYTGTGLNLSINVGFEPAFILVKRTNAISAWRILDNKRFSGANKSSLSAQASAAEQVGYIDVGFNSSDFTINSTNVDFNASGGTYIYMAFAAT